MSPFLIFGYILVSLLLGGIAFAVINMLIDFFKTFGKSRAHNTPNLRHDAHHSLH